MKRYLLLALLILGSTAVFAQKNHSVKGRVTDPGGKPLGYATVVLLQPSDSVIAHYAFSDDKGHFTFKGVKTGDYIIQATFMGFRNYNRKISVKSDMSLSNLAMRSKSRNLTEFEVEAELIPIVIKEDTIEYNADAFKTQPNSVVEDLLKKLPGVEVEDDGTIKAQGETVQKVLVDGKEFFGDDPKMATKNLPADAIDKVQIFDKESEMAEFSGVDDGEQIKTINLKLKEDKKRGYFGNASAGYGYPENRYTGKFNVNKFNKKSQLSAIGMANNNNERGFSFQDYIRFMGGFESMMAGGGFRSSTSESGIPMDPSSNSGITTTWAGGGNLNAELSNNTDLYTSYFYSLIGTDLQRQANREYFNTSSNFTSLDTSTQNTDFQNHSINMRLKHKLDTTSDIQLKGVLKFNTGSATSFSATQNFNAEAIPTNSNLSYTGSEGTGMDIKTDLIYRKRLKKPGRTFVTELEYDLTPNQSNATVDAYNSFILQDSLQTMLFDTVIQNQDLTNEKIKYGGKISWTEPLGKSRYLEFNYRHRETVTSLKKDFFDVSAQSQQEVFNPQLSSEYQNVFKFDKAGIQFKINRKKSNLTIGAGAQYSQLDGDLISADTALNKEFLHFIPKLRYTYRFAASNRIRIRYDARVNAPSIEQLQPVVDNSNPLKLYVGNPDLLAEYSHTARMSYHYFSQFSFTSIFASLRGTYTQDKITNAVTIDSLLRQLSRPMNVDKDLLLAGYASFSTPLRPLGIKVRISANNSFNQGILFVNANENNTNRIVTGVDFSISNRKKNHVDIRVGTKYSHNVTMYSEDKQMNQEFLTTTYYTDMVWYMNDTWTIGTKFNYKIYGGEAFSEETAIPIWKAHLSKLFLKDNKGELKFLVFDILDENRGFSRTSDLNYVEEELTNSIGRYFMVSFAYSLSGFGNKSAGSRSQWRRH